MCIAADLLWHNLPELPLEHSRETEPLPYTIQAWMQALCSESYGAANKGKISIMVTDPSPFVPQDLRFSSGIARANNAKIGQ